MTAILPAWPRLLRISSSRTVCGCRERGRSLFPNSNLTIRTSTFHGISSTYSSHGRSLVVYCNHLSLSYTKNTRQACRSCLYVPGPKRKGQLLEYSSVLKQAARVVRAVQQNIDKEKRALLPYLWMMAGEVSNLFFLGERCSLPVEISNRNQRLC